MIGDKIFERTKEVSRQLGVEWFLHKAGYTYFNMGRLTYKQKRQILDGYDIVEKGTGV